MLPIKMLLNLAYFKPVKYTYPNDIMHEISKEDVVLKKKKKKLAFITQKETTQA